MDKRHTCADWLSFPLLPTPTPYTHGEVTRLYPIMSASPLGPVFVCSFRVVHFLEQYRKSCNQVVCPPMVQVKREHLSVLKRRNVPGEKVYTEAPITMFAYCNIAGDVSIVLNQCIDTV